MTVNDAAPDLREVIMRAIHAADCAVTNDYSETFEDDDKIHLGAEADAVIAALAAQADARFEAAVEQYGKWRAIARKEWDCQCVGCQSVIRFAKAKSAERTLLALHAAATRRPVIDDAAVERFQEAYAADWNQWFSDSHAVRAALEAFVNGGEVVEK